MANIVLKTYAAGDNNQGSVTPQNDALIYQAAVPMNGLFFGGAITLSSANVLHVAAGMGIIGGRFFEVLESDISVQLSASGDLLGRLYIHLDLSNADNPISIETYTGASLPALSGDPNLNVSNGVFDMELCTFSINELTISNIIQTFPTITAANNQIRRAAAYSVNDFVLCQSASDALIFICTTAGTTAVQEPTAYATVTDGNTVTDGTAVFKAVSVSGQITKLSKTEVLANNAQQMIAPIQTTLVALKAYAVGEQFVYNGLLYKATATIAQGNTITIGGNCALAGNVTEQLKWKYLGQKSVNEICNLPTTWEEVIVIGTKIAGDYGWGTVQVIIPKLYVGNYITNANGRNSIMCVYSSNTSIDVSSAATVDIAEYRVYYR